MLALSVLALSSCKKNKSVTPDNTTSVSFKFNSTVFSTSTVTTTYDKTQGTIQLLGVIDSKTSIYLKINGGVKAGTFSLTDGGASGIFTADGQVFTSGASGPDDTGTITITSFTDNTIAGTFYFTGKSSADGSAYAVTGGKFQSKYQSK